MAELDGTLFPVDDMWCPHTSTQHVLAAKGGAPSMAHCVLVPAATGTAGGQVSNARKQGRLLLVVSCEAHSCRQLLSCCTHQPQ